MRVDQSAPDRRIPDRFAAAAAFLVILIGSLVVLGWTLGLEWLKRVAPGLVAMNPMTAVLFLLLGVALLWSGCLLLVTGGMLRAAERPNVLVRQPNIASRFAAISGKIT